MLNQTTHITAVFCFVVSFGPPFGLSCIRDPVKSLYLPKSESMDCIVRGDMEATDK